MSDEKVIVSKGLLDNLSDNVQTLTGTAEKMSIQEMSNAVGARANEIFEFIEETLPNEYAKKTEIPTKTSQLENDSGFLTEHQDISHLQEKLNDEQLSNIADIPNKVSADYVNTAIQAAITDVLGGAS